MKLKLSIFSCLFFFACCYAVAQMGAYDYARELKGVSGQWHKIELPDDIFGKTLYNLNDIRIFGIMPDKDTVEVPCLLQLATDKTEEKEVPFKMLNASSNSRGYYFTFQTLTDNPVNEISLAIGQPNFDWRIDLEGSQDQSEWFTIIRDYRILSIRNGLTDFAFTKLHFPVSKYRYFRLFFNSREKPVLSGVTIARKEIQKGALRTFPTGKLNATNNKQTKQTDIYIRLSMPVPVSRLRLNVKDTIDYYRPVSIQYIRDSIKIEKGWLYDYGMLASGILNSMEEATFKCNSTVVQNLKVVIDNKDNIPLTIDSVVVEGYVHTLFARFTENARYFLVYGNRRAEKPSYDLNFFADKIPATLTPLALGDEQRMQKELTAMPEPLFKNKAWLWALMVVIIVLLGWFSLKMIRGK
jgi:hypothetical protein